MPIPTIPSLRRSLCLGLLAASVAAAPALAADAVEQDAGQAAQPRGLTEEGKLRQPKGAERWEQVEETINPGTTAGRDDVDAGEGPEALPPGPVQSVVRPEPLEPATPPTDPDVAQDREAPDTPLQDTLPSTDGDG